MVATAAAELNVRSPKMADSQEQVEAFEAAPTSRGPLFIRFDGYQLSCIDMELEEIPQELATSYGAKVRRLDLSSNKICCLKRLAEFPRITELILDNNHLGDIVDFPSIPGLKTLSLNKNRISNLDRFLDTVEHKCPQLTFLSMMSNPACPNELVWGKDEDDYTRYRCTVIQRLPLLRFLDSVPVSNKERSSSERQMGIFQRLMPIIQSWGSKSKFALPAVDLSMATLKFFKDKVNETRWPAMFWNNRRAVLGLAPLSDKWIVCCGTDGCIRIFDLTPGKWEYKCVAILKGHTGRVRSVCCFADVRVVSCGEDKAIRIWDLSVQKCLRTLKGHRGAVNSVIALADGRVVSGGADATVRVWNIGAKQCSMVLTGHYGGVVCLIQTGKEFVASGSLDEKIKIWDLRAETCSMTLVGHTGDVRCLAAMIDGWLVSGSADKTIKIWQQSGTAGKIFRAHDPLEPSGRGCVGTLRGHTGVVESVSAISDCKILSGSEDRTVALWDILANVCLAVFIGHEDPVNCVVGLADGRIASGGTTIKIWDPASQAMEEEESVMLTRQFNETNNSATSTQRSIWSSTQAGLKGLCASVLGVGRNRGSVEVVASEDTHVASPYSHLSSTYPSTISMFATCFSEEETQGNNEALVDKHGTEIQPESSDVTHARNLLNVLFASSKDDGSGSLSNNVLWGRVKEWRRRLRKKKGPKVVNWLGIFKAQQGQELVMRLDELCREVGLERVTYIAVKNALIDEFGEDLFEHMKEQVSVELAMREFEFTKGEPQFKAQQALEHSDFKPSTVFFPEVKASPVSARKQYSQETFDSDMEPGSPQRPRHDLDTSLEEFLIEYFQEVGEGSDNDHEFVASVQATMNDLESGRVVPSDIDAQPEQLWKTAVSNATFAQDVPDPLEIPSEDEEEEEEVIVVEPLKVPVRVPSVILRNEIEI
eukprot:m.253687 g.253687  ORF g.253687 m.253687 type:complete len:935 (+) comp16162_c0_seq7:125-2929(+)